jgi:hypothetical protein
MMKSSAPVSLPPVKPGKKLNTGANFKVGQMGARHGSEVHGGGGPENVGAVNSDTAALPYYESRPAWSYDDNNFGEFIGCAAPSTTPNLAGIPANNFRGLGDDHGGRQ